MTNYFKNLVDGYNQATNETVKTVLYDAMEKYADEYHDGYVCYDMDMYTALYKCAMTPEQVKIAWKHIRSIIVDESHQFIDEIVKNFEEFLSIKDFLREGDKTEFDSLCMIVIDFFERKLQWEKDLEKCGQADFYPDIPSKEVEAYLAKVKELILNTKMSDLESYKRAFKK